MKPEKPESLVDVLQLRAASLTRAELKQHGIGVQCSVPGCLSWADAYDGYCRPCAFGRTSETIVGPRA